MESSTSQPAAPAADDSKILQRVVRVGMALGCFSVITQILLLSPFPGKISVLLNDIQFALVVPALLIGVGAAVLALPVLMIKRLRATAKLVLFGGLFLASWTLLGLGVAQAIRTASFENFATRSEFLTEAIAKFDLEQHRVPNDLSELVPFYLPKIPETGMGAYPKYKYELLVKCENPWKLSVDCSTNLLNFDQIFYWPNQRYPPTVDGGVVEILDRWAYVHK